MDEEYLTSMELDMQSPIYLNSNQVEELLASQNIIRPYSINPDECEPNDTIFTAYPYEQVPVVNEKLTNINQLFGLGMRHAGLHSATDEDWYSIDLTAGETYFVDLRNIRPSNWYIELYYLSNNGGYYYTTNPSEVPAFENWHEKYFYFEAQNTGTYYIHITSGGEGMDEMHYFFYVGPAIQYFDIEGMPTGGSVQIFGNGYQTYTCDLREDVPATTAIVNLYVVSSFLQGTECSEVEVYMSAGGKTYYNASGGLSNAINNIAGAPLGQIWTIGGRCANGLHYTRWTARLYGRFACIMAPFPGNEVSF